jgi:lipopolysaccharide transport system ATP-binding protein
VISFSIHTENGLGNILTAFRPAKFLFGLLAEETQDFDCRYGIAIHDYSGICMTRIFSPQDKFSINKGEIRKIAMVLNPTQIGPGDYTLSISVHENCPIEKINFARRYDLLSRSFSVKVELPDSLAALDSRFFQTAEWKFSSSLKCK